MDQHPPGRRVLVVEDDSDIRSMIVALLQDDGFEARSVASGREALALAESWRPDVIVLDLVLSENEAWRVSPEQRRLASVGVPIVLISAAIPRVLAAAAADLGAAATLRKPFDAEALLDLIRGLVD